ncbi:hypothetical protein A249_24232 [Pseudomonas syringae pv. actinidiae ICMP 18804]|nr:hypothetical protein A249_24232 [Pseudomonas syringae pv. actinidiae ICMP 18804]
MGQNEKARRWAGLLLLAGPTFVVRASTASWMRAFFHNASLHCEMQYKAIGVSEAFLKKARRWAGL